jgi:predicted naringenin-chalcone synthase
MTTFHSPSPAPRTRAGLRVAERATAVALGWGTALPPFGYRQDELAERLAAPLDPAAGRRLRAAFRGSRIERRHSVLPDFGPAEPRLFRGSSPTTAERMAVYAAEAPALGDAAARSALAGAGMPASAITHLLFVTCTGFVSPGPDRDLVLSLGLDSGVRRLQIGYQGCSAGIVALRTAAEIVRGEPDACVLVVAVELASLHFQTEIGEAELRGHALFADGAGAAIVAGSRAVRAAGGGSVQARVQLGRGASELVEGSADDMTWDVGDTGFLMRLSARVPEALSAALPSFVRALAGEATGAVRHWAIHPGGPVILDRLAHALGLASDRLGPSRDALRSAGNMSSATIFFVFERLLHEGPGNGIALAFGPGLTIEGLRFRVGA